MWDPEAAGTAAVFLRLDAMALIEIRSAPFSAKTAVWVPDKVSIPHSHTRHNMSHRKSATSKVKRLEKKKTEN